MNKILKNILGLSLTFFVSPIFSSCAPQQETKKNSISLNYKNLNLIIGETKMLVPSYEIMEGFLLQWESTNENIVTVDMDGYVEAINKGSANIIASYGDSQAVCTVSVTSDVYTPTLHFENEIGDSVNVAKNQQLNLATYIEFNNRKFYDANVTYKLSNSEAGTIEGNVFTAGSKSNINSVLVVTASWRNFDVPSLKLQTTINVVDLTSIVINNGETGNMILNTISNIKEKTYKTEEILSSIKGLENGEFKSVDEVKLEENIALSGGEAVELIWNGTSGKITALKEGSAKLVVSFDKTNGEKYSQSFDIQVTKPIYEITEPIKFFSASDGQFYNEQLESFESLANLFESGEKKISKAYQGENELTLEGDKVFGVVSPVSNEMGTVTISIFNNVMGLKLKLETYQKVIADYSGFVNLFPKSGSTVTGYVVLVNNIIHSEEVEIPNGAKSIFNGIFDGLGHYVTMSLKHNSPNDEWGLFGNELGGTVRNVAFNNCTLSVGSTGIIAHHSNGNAALSNVFNKTRMIKGGAYQFETFYSTYGSCKFNNVVIDSTDVHDPNASQKGCIGLHKHSVGSSDNYVITTNEAGKRSDIGTYFTQAEYNAGTETNKYLISDFKRYSTVQDMINAHNDLSSFSDDYWDVSSGYPVFKSLI